ncbi:alpha/beta hydrolase family protein [Medicago truncatula]|uniref:Alpha/beta hydrolase family protein n=1 Tax=Medicago truncatula TaxID=3880 RepID=A0A072U4W8_MEDTR|nr:alpha/beta hydrolase family protein [Medicago truncatula]
MKKIICFPRIESVLIFDYAVCQIIHLKYWRYKLMLQVCMFSLFLETQVLFYSTRTLWNFCMNFLGERHLSQASKAIGQVSHSRKDWEHGRLFSLQDQIDHKIDFIKEELQNIEIPIILVGHSIGSYISIEMFKKTLEKVNYCVGLYPFLTLNPHSTTQLIIAKIAQYQFVAAALSYLTASLGFLPVKALRFIVGKSLGKSWSANAVEAACSHLSQYHTMRNVLYMAMSEFKKLAEAPDWTFLRERKDQCAFLFGVGDHWGPLQLLEEISNQVPGIALSIERENHTHGFCCTEAGSLWVAQHVANLIKNQIACTNQ